MAGLYIIAGINHFWHPLTYKKMMPPWLCGHFELIYISGVFEILLGILLIPVFTRRAAAWGLILLLIAVLPANVQMVLNYKNENNPYLWVTIIRLPLQLLLIWWAYRIAKMPNSISKKINRAV